MKMPSRKAPRTFDREGHNARYWTPIPGGIAERAVNVMKALRRATASPTERGSSTPQAHPEAMTMTSAHFDEGLRLAVEKAGSIRALARELGISAPSLLGWKRVPTYRIKQVEMVTGIRREKLRPDLYRSATSS